ncbi:hypothetical protein [Mesorhizobium sp. BR1-1-2]|uniref:hypothetical protein n=1 Tax=Mesorhizobium sp. BR1-1-2 TaxID=2876652 RepID=UPI001CCBAC9E|nr:hypothetical protein [Mesorhizobium sp. BR1-1-2]MBZ9966319.1 hypothetical protein [Mesorhizobium sp. BR1-1-2]
MATMAADGSILKAIVATIAFAGFGQDVALVRANWLERPSVSPNSVLRLGAADAF